MIQGWKILTPDFRPPVQGGELIFDGTFPFTTAKVSCDTGPNECSYGWNFAKELETAFRIGGFWPTGRPNVAVMVETESAIERGGKLRTEQLHLLRFATPDEIRDAIHRFSAVFGRHRDAMADEMCLWYRALGRPNRDRSAVVAGLEKAVETRKLDLTLTEFPDVKAVWDAKDAWDDKDAWGAWVAWDAWDARDVRDAWVDWVAWDTRASRAAWDARNAWTVRDNSDAWTVRDSDARAARGAWVAWAVRDARAAKAICDARAAKAARVALAGNFAARSGWISHQSADLSTGIRDAYMNGLEIALPIGPKELGWSMEK